MQNPARKQEDIKKSILPSAYYQNPKITESFKWDQETKKEGSGRVSPIEVFSHESQTKAEAIAGLCFHGEGFSQAASIGAEQYF